MPDFYCRLCNEQVKPIFSSTILDKFEIKYYYCKNCGLLQTENPYWFEESYQESINVSDTGILARNIQFSKITATIIYFFYNNNAKFLDYAGGYGIFTRLMRDIGFDFYWHDLYTQNLVAKEFEVSAQSEIELITCFECFEHLVNPIDDIEKMLKISKNIFFSTSLLPNPIPNPEDWWYYGLEHGQHIAIYSRKTLDYIASKYGLNIYSYGDIHLFTKKKIHPYLFKFVIKHSKELFDFIVKNKKKSLTFSDMENIIKKRGKQVVT